MTEKKKSGKLTKKLALSVVHVLKSVLRSAWLWVKQKRLKRLKGTNKVSLLEKYGYTEEMAAELCKARGLYSPAYEYSVRNGCWFCPNCRMSEFAEFKRRHPELWQKLLELGKVENRVSKGFCYGKSIEMIDETISMQAAQVRIEDIEEK